MTPAEEGKLSKDEVEALLQATKGGEEQQTETLAHRSEQPGRRVHGYDFQQPSRFSKTQLEKLRRINETLAQNATSHASRLLRSNVKTQLVSIDQMKWENLLEEAGDAVIGFVFVLEPLGYRAVMTMDSQFAAAALERMMGGHADAGGSATLEFTDLDVRVLTNFARAFLSPLPQLWHRVGEFSVELGRFVEDLQALDLFPGGEDFVEFCFLMQSNVGSGQIVLAVPFQAVRSLPPDVDQASNITGAADEGTDEALRQNLKHTKIELRALLGTADVKVGRLVRIEPGDVIVLDTRIGETVRVMVNDKVKFRGYPGRHNGRYAVRLTREE